jgi:glycosyltransferase involved in cell wall biosynthesis
MKILMSAYSCEPGRGSEPGVGWNIVRAVAQHHEVWVLTRPDESGDIIQAELDRHPVPNLHFVYFTLPIWGGGWRWGESGAMQIHYYLWQIQAYFVARKLHQEIGFDIVHHVTFVKYSNPSFLSFLPIPFVWGPVGGGESAPSTFWQDFSLRAKAYEWARAIVRRIGELDPFVRLTGQRSAIIRATTEDTAQRLRHLGASAIQIVTESGLSTEDISQLAQCPIPNATPIRFISMGRLLHWKGFHLGIRAFAKANLPDAEYWILGDGAEQHRLQALAIELGVGSQVKFLGKLPRAATLEKLADCHILVHPSLHDSGGWVCLEAMAAARPVLCLDLGGPAVQVTDQTGIKIPALNPHQTVRGLASAMVRLAVNEQLRSQLGNAGQKRVHELYSWQAKGEELSHLYQTLAQASPLPSGVRHLC